MDRHTKKAPPPLPLPESDYPPVLPLVLPTAAEADRAHGEAITTSTASKVSPTTLRARRFPTLARRHTQSENMSNSPASSQAPMYGRSPVVVSPTGTGAGLLSAMSREALASLAVADTANKHSLDSVVDMLAASEMQRAVTVIYPQREGSDLDAEDPGSPIGGPDPSMSYANQDLAQVRVEGYFDGSVGVLIPNDLPKSTLLYVLTASDGRDSMFKCVQYFLQLVICFLHTSSLFSPEMRVFTGTWAEHFYRNYNTIRHGRSLFKMGRGFLNLFTAQAVASRLWLRYGDDIRMTFYPVTWRAAALLLRIDSTLRALGLALVTEKMRIQLAVTAAVGPAGEGDDALADGANDASVNYYYSQARMRVHMKHQQRLRAEANTLLTDDVYTHVSKAELGARQLSAHTGESPVSGNVSEGVSPTTAFSTAHAGPGMGVDAAAANAQNRPFYVRDVLHGGSGGSGGITGSFSYPAGTLTQSASLGTPSSSKGGSWVARLGAGAGTGAGSGAGLLAGTQQAPRLGTEAPEGGSYLSVDLLARPETAAPTPNAAAPLQDSPAQEEDYTPLSLGPSAAAACEPSSTHASASPQGQTVPIGLGSLKAHGLRFSDSQTVTGNKNNSSDENGGPCDPLTCPTEDTNSLSTNPGTGVCRTGTTGGGGPKSLSTTVTEDGTQDGSHTRTSTAAAAAPRKFGLMEDFSGCQTLSVNDPRFAQLRKPRSGRDSLIDTPKVKSETCRRRTAAPLSVEMEAAGGTSSALMLSPDLSTRKPSSVYEPDDTSLPQSSDSDESLPYEATRAGGDTDAPVRSRTLAMSAASNPHSPAQSGGSPVGADPWASAVQAAALVPAAIAAPAHWRKKPMQFNTLLMVLLGVRSCSAAIRRFLRDATLVSSERFFNTDIIERHRARIHRTFNYAWIVVAVIDLLLNTIRLVQPGWTKYATARQNVRCRCGCTSGDPSDVVWRTSDFIARRKTDLFFPSLDLDYGAPAVSYISYFDAADPVHMMPACSHCGYLYKEVSKVSMENEPSSSKPQWLKLYEDAAATAHSAGVHHTRESRVGSGGLTGGHARATSERGTSAVSGDALVMAGASVASRDRVHGAPLSNPASGTSVGTGGFGTAEALVETGKNGDSHGVSMLYLPYLMRRVFNYVWLLRCHPNWSSTLLLQLRYSAELFLAWKYCFGGYEPYRTDAPMAAVLHPLGAMAGLISASVCLLRVVESAPK